MKQKRLTFMQFVNELKQNFKTLKPVKVRRCQMPFDKTFEEQKRLYGDCIECENNFVIRVNKESDISVQKDTIMHEWAHAMVGWDVEKDSHTNEWGIAYSKIYRRMVGD